MSCPRLDEVSSYWSDDPGALLDVYVSSTDADDWQSAVDAVRALGWPSSYSGDGEPSVLPSEVSRSSLAPRLASCLWTIRPTNEIVINCHFFDQTEIEFDFDPREVTAQSDLDLVCDFITVIGQRLGKPVAVGIESSHPRPPPMMSYEPASDRVVVVAGTS